MNRSYAFLDGWFRLKEWRGKGLGIWLVFSLFSSFVLQQVQYEKMKRHDSLIIFLNHLLLKIYWNKIYGLQNMHNPQTIVDRRDNIDIEQGTNKTSFKFKKAKTKENQNREHYKVDRTIVLPLDINRPNVARSGRHILCCSTRQVCWVIHIEILNF